MRLGVVVWQKSSFNIHLFGQLYQLLEFYAAQLLFQVGFYHLVDLVTCAQQNLLPKILEDSDYKVDDNADFCVAEKIPNGKNHRLRHVLRKKTHDPLHHEVVQLEAVGLKMIVNFGEEVLEFVV